MSRNPRLKKEEKVESTEVTNRLAWFDHPRTARMKSQILGVPELFLEDQMFE